MTEQEIAAHQPVLRSIPLADGNDDGRATSAPMVAPVQRATATARISDMFVAEEHMGALGTFAPTDVELSKHRRQEIARIIFLLMALSLVIPVILILGDLLIKAWPALTWSFLTRNPENRMTAGGIWAPLVGTFCLVLFSLM